MAAAASFVAGGVIDKAAFSVVTPIIALRIPKKECSNVRHMVHNFVFSDRKGVKAIVDDKASPDGNTKLLLLSSSILNTELEGMSDDIKEKVRAMNLEAVPYDLVLGYDDLRVEEVMQKILPADMHITYHFETAGHIAHLNLRDEQLPYKYFIGQVLLDKNPALKTIVNKCESISNQFRVFPMEKLAGSDDMLVTVRESDCTFKFDYSKVYWNSRLQFEHCRLVSTLRPTDVVCDVFAGVGPFAIPAAVKGCTVHANDLNPESYHWLLENVRVNKLPQGRLTAYNMDGRDFVRSLISQGIHFTQVIMNLPACAELFLDVFKTAFTRPAPLPTINCYCFSSEEDPIADAIQRVEAVVGGMIPGLTIHDVRGVAPKKRMLCATFVLPPHIGYRVDDSSSDFGASAVPAPPTPATTTTASTATTTTTTTTTSLPTIPSTDGTQAMEDVPGKSVVKRARESGGEGWEEDTTDTDSSSRKGKEAEEEEDEVAQGKGDDEDQARGGPESDEPSPKRPRLS